MQNSTFLVLLRPIFAAKIKIDPPSGFGRRSCEELAVIWIRIVDFFGSGAHPKSVKTFFLEITVLIFTGKILWISVKTFFFGDHLILTEKPLQSNSRLMKIWVKFVYGCNKLPKRHSPLCQILASRLDYRFKILILPEIQINHKINGSCAARLIDWLINRACPSQEDKIYIRKHGALTSKTA